MTTPSVRTITGNVLSSSHDPSIKLRVADDFTYVGRLQFVLYDVADADIFVFVSAGPDKKVDRLLIAQFEGYLDSNSHTYNYPPAGIVALGRHNYIHDTFAYPVAAEFERSDSDSARTFNLILGQGYKIPDEIISCRLVRLLDDARRKEILFSYGEDLSLLGFATAAQVADDGRLKRDYAGLADDLLARALLTFELVED